VIFRRGAFEIEVEWDHGPDVSLIFYGHRTHIFSISYVAYPTLRSASEPHFIGVLDRMWKQVYADSPTETPFREMVKDLPRHGKNIQVANQMIEAMEAIADDPINDLESIREMNDLELQRKIEAAGRQVERNMLTPNRRRFDRRRFAVNIHPPGWSPEDDAA
jgi:hypothetical protein